MRYGWAERPVAKEQLYDLVFDPTESCDVANEASLAQALDEMRARLSHWMEERDDPLLHGRVPAPSGAKANDPNGMSPREAPVEIKSENSS